MSRKPCSGGECVRRIALPCGSQILYSNRRPMEAILVDRDEWIKFLAEVKAGGHDVPEPTSPARRRRNQPMSAGAMRDRVAAEEAR